MKFKKKWLQNLICDDVNDGETMEDEIVDTTRWSVRHNIVFKYNEKFFEIEYSRAATELQDERPFDFSPDDVECKEVFPVERMVIRYE